MGSSQTTTFDPVSESQAQAGGPAVIYTTSKIDRPHVLRRRYFSYCVIRNDLSTPDSFQLTVADEERTGCPLFCSDAFAVI
jgi:hypothetical protein